MITVFRHRKIKSGKYVTLKWKYVAANITVLRVSNQLSHALNFDGLDEVWIGYEQGQLAFFQFCFHLQLVME